LLKDRLSVTVAGSGAGGAVRTMLAAPAIAGRVRFIDSPSQMAPLYAAHSLTAIPLLEGSGTRGRILESLANGRLVVTTPKGAEGLDLGTEQGVLLATSPADFAETLFRWADAASAPDRRRLAAQGRERVRVTHDWSVVAREIVEAWSAACAARPKVSPNDPPRSPLPSAHVQGTS
jgi:glycosyltransferase involved in cell wall biosynthesis